jgi:hypothetical protein
MVPTEARSRGYCRIGSEPGTEPFLDPGAFAGIYALGRER